MRIAICDDERRFICDFTTIVNSLYKSLDIIVDEYSNGTALARSFEIRNYDLVFLDIEMPEMDGLSLAARLRSISSDVFIVFLTSHIEYAVKGYEVNALRYLTKPAKKEDIHSVIEYVLNRKANEKSLWVKNSEGSFRVRLSDILFIEAQDQNIVIYTQNDSYVMRGKINDLEKQLKINGFYRIHRSYIVSLSKITAIVGKEVTVVGGFKLPVARGKEKDFKDAFMSSVSKEAF